MSCRVGCFLGCFWVRGGKHERGALITLQYDAQHEEQPFFLTPLHRNSPEKKKGGKKTHLLPFHCLVAWLLSGQWGYSLHFSLPSMTLNPLFFFKMNHSSVERLNSPFFLRKTADGKTRGIFTQQRGLLQKNTIFFFFSFLFFWGYGKSRSPLAKKNAFFFFPNLSLSPKKKQPLPLVSCYITFSSLASTSCVFRRAFSSSLSVSPGVVLFFFSFFSALSSRSEGKYGAVNQKARWSAGVCWIFRGGGDFNRAERW